MKIHINKDKKESKGLFGLGSTKTWFVVEAHYELNDEEKKLLNQNKHVLSLEAFDFPFRGLTGEITGENSPTIKQLTGGKPYPLGCVFSNGELQELEGIINEGAKNLKAEIYGGGQGTSITEI